ncbi:NADP-dependent oxidoreductase [Actinomyces sp. zg-332]|uniref:NADP-dependent oxidoreductase n=1 Tax=Actinomyces sp. zg-332 TaxID=2708340 RepID=UPI00142307AA|nr:NADP-dependent oxidoreductase [Actinomyces sp. zg-332]QPK93601.1 NADP-dependent oxidoreductase [Actinomyces sp. zg-332]
MKAAQLRKYNKENIKLEIIDLPKPVPTDTQVLIKVNAAGVNPVDNMITRGEVKLLLPYSLPLTAGNEVVGIVEEVGAKVSDFKAGDRVFARLPLRSIGAFAEYVAVEENALALVPSYLNDEQAACVPLTALTVMQAMDLMRVEAGKTIFISGGTGGVGAMAIPIAKAKGLKVITNGNATNKERVLALGADQFIDYKTQDYAEVVSNVDYVLDTLGGSHTQKQISILKAGGHIVSLKGVPNKKFAKRFGLSAWKQFLIGLVGRKLDKLAEEKDATYDFIFVESNGKQLQEVAGIFSQLRIQPSIDTVYDFKDINKALEKVANGNSRGKTLIVFK